MNSSFEEWEKLMRDPYSGATETVMGLITRMFKQTAIAKVHITWPSCVCVDTNYLMYLIFKIKRPSCILHHVFAI